MELSLDLSLVYVPKTMTEFLGEISSIRDCSERLSKLNEYVKNLEDEMRKIDAFKRELPLCMLLLNDAIGRLKEEAMHWREVKDGPVMEEFIPLKGNSKEDEGVNLGSDYSDKKNWMSSAQLWSTDFKQNPVSELKRGQSGFSITTMEEEDKEVSKVPGLSLLAPIVEIVPCNTNLKNIGSGRGASGSTMLLTDQFKLQTKPQTQQHQQQTVRKHRRCWSPELHRRFVDALQQLGGSQAATPKQIRELMQVEGLTNDEVKSHLQKYRLHVRKLPASSSPALVNGLWMAQNQRGEHSKPNHLQSDSPQGPLVTGGPARGFSSMGGDSAEAEGDEKSEGHSWKSELHNLEDVDEVII